jgi:hypothetical protein
VPVPGDQEPGPDWEGPQAVDQPVEGALNAFDITFDGRRSAGRSNKRERSYTVKLS